RGLAVLAHVRPAPAKRGVGQRLERAVQLVELVGDPVQALEAVEPAADHLELAAQLLDPIEERLEAAVGVVDHVATAWSPASSSSASTSPATSAPGGAAAA